MSTNAEIARRFAGQGNTLMQGPKGPLYRVLPGDTLSEILDRFLPGHWTAWARRVEGLNGLDKSPRQMLQPGDVLQLPPEAIEPRSTRIVRHDPLVVEKIAADVAGAMRASYRRAIDDAVKACHGVAVFGKADSVAQDALNLRTISACQDAVRKLAP